MPEAQHDMAMGKKYGRRAAIFELGELMRSPRVCVFMAGILLLLANLVLMSRVSVPVCAVGSDLEATSSGPSPRRRKGPAYSRRLDRTKKYDVCTVGAGLSGTIIAERYATVLGKTALVIDSRDHVGGNCYDFVDPSTRVLMNKYGAHLFHTSSEKAWRYLTMHRDAPAWTRWDHEVKGWIDERLVPIPANINTVNRLFDLSISSEPEMEAWLREKQVPCPAGGCRNAEHARRLENVPHSDNAHFR